MRLKSLILKRKKTSIFLALVLAVLVKTVFFPAPLARAHKTWKNEDGVVTYRPMGRAERTVFAILSLGLSETSTAMVGRKMPEADLDSFRSLSEAYAVDKNAVWYRGEKVVGAAPESFFLFPSGSHGADQAHVFYGKERLEGADPERFRTAGTHYGYDDAGIWQRSGYVMEAPRAGGVLTVIAADYNIIRFDDVSYFQTVPMERAPVGEVHHLCLDWFLAGEELFRGPVHVAEGRAAALYLGCTERRVHRVGGGAPDVSGGVVFAEERALVEYTHDKTRRALVNFDAEIARAVSLQGQHGIHAYQTYLLQLDGGEVEVIALEGDEVLRQTLGSGSPLDFEQVFATYGRAEVFGTLYEAVRPFERGEGLLLREGTEVETPE